MLGFVRSVGGAADPGAFDPAWLRLDASPPSPLPRRWLYALLALLAAIATALVVGRLDIVAVAEGRLVPRTLVKIVQPADAGVVRDILVEEGMAVIPGQLLLRLDARLAEADVRAFRGELAQRLLQLRRIDAELADRPLERHGDDPDDAFARTAAQHGANQSAHRDAVLHATSQVARIAQELAAASEIERKLDRTVPIARTMAERYARLQTEGFVSELFALERERDRIEREQDLLAQRHTVQALRASLEQADRGLAQVVSNRRRQLHAERADAAAQLARVREELDKQLVRREQVELAAPAGGIVKELAVRTPGTVVAAGTVLVTIVPAGEPLEAEVLVKNDDVGFVRAGQSARLKIAPFPFQRYGFVDAEVIRIGPDASDLPARGTQAEEPPAPAAPAYRARLKLRSQALVFDDQRLPLVPGMSVAAEIHLGHRPALDYLLAPVQKAWHEAARER